MTTRPAIEAVYRGSRARARDWRDCEIVGQDEATGKLVLREVGKFYRGVWLADHNDVRIVGAAAKALASR